MLDQYQLRQDILCHVAEAPCHFSCRHAANTLRTSMTMLTRQLNSQLISNMAHSQKYCCVVMFLLRFGHTECWPRSSRHSWVRSLIAHRFVWRDWCLLQTAIDLINACLFRHDRKIYFAYFCKYIFPWKSTWKIQGRVLRIYCKYDTNRYDIKNWSFTPFLTSQYFYSKYYQMLPCRVEFKIKMLMTEFPWNSYGQKS